MIDILNYFEELDEAVYVSDIENRDLIYLNATLRKHYGYQSHEEYSGLKCYEVFGIYGTPCPTCNIPRMKDKTWLSWIYTSQDKSQKFLVKNRAFRHKGKKYRIGVLLNIEASPSNHNEHYMAIYNSIVNGCLQDVISTVSAEKSIDQLLAYIGSEFLCDRVYVFELHDNGFMSNTYEWCAEGSVPQKEILQNESIECIDWWMEKFQRKEIVFIRDVEEIKTEHPMTYSTLKPQNVSAMAAVPICIHGKIYGFIGVDNPDCSMLHVIEPLLEVVEKLMPLLIKCRDLVNDLEWMSFYDQLTGAFNYSAMEEQFEDTSSLQNIGIHYFDIIGLKRTNDTLGYEAGDFMIRKCYQHLRDLLKTDQIYRICGDEFVCVCSDCSKADFQQQAERLKEDLRIYQYHIAFGSVWSDQKPLDFHTLMTQAAERMQQDKWAYYAKEHMIQKADPEEYQIPHELAAVDRPDQFMTVIAHNTEAFFRSIAEHNPSGYFYFGDVQKNLYFISDNMREDFGFKSNIVPDFLQAWGEVIATARFRKLYLQNLNRLLAGEQSILELRYPVRDTKGRIMWVQNYGIVTREEERKNPVFFSGRITHQDNSFVVDPVTNFPRESVLWSELEELQESAEPYHVIGFRFNYVTEINHIHGRKYTDCLLNDIAVQLLERLSDKMAFYRSEGIRCIAVINPEYSIEQEVLIHQICEIVKDSYHRVGLFFPHPCSAAVLAYDPSEMTMDEFRNNLEALVKAAQHTPTQEYLRGSAEHPQTMKKLSSMELALNENVLHGMENFRVVVQPTVSAEHEIIKGGEVLLRWKFQDKDISPAVFVPMLEKSHIIHFAGRWVFEQAVRTCSRIISYYPDFYLSFNVSLYQLNDTGFVEFMQKTLNKYHLDASHLVAEITESCLDEQPEMLMLFIQACKKIGLRLAMDDFGSGYSSLRMLLQYPYNIIKLDRSLLQKLTVSDHSQSFIRSIVYACHQCKKQVCVEGVETEEENTIIKETDCDIIQGYYHHRPMELNQLYELINKSEV